jgi:cold shock protein
LATGKVLQFDHVRGYGFVTAEDGGEDIFLHASVLDEDPETVRPGMRVEFEVMNGDRGRKAFAAHLIQDRINGDGPTLSPRLTLPILAQPTEEIASSPAQEIVTPRAGAEVTSTDPAPDLDEEQLCDVLSPEEFTHALTELLLRTAPGLTGQQILDVRQGLLEFAQQHRWSDG